MNTTRPLVIYHGNCPDGFGAALAAWLKFGDQADYVGADYKNPVPPDCTGRDVYVLDYCYPPEATQVIVDQATALTVLDHHASSKERMQGHALRCLHCKPLLHFDLNRSGAALAWEHFHPGKPMPVLFRYIEDRDLWRWVIPETRDFLTSVDILPFTFEAWAPLLDMTKEQVKAFTQKGRVMYEKYMALCHSIAERAAPLTFQGETGLWVSGTSEFNSDVGNILAERCGTFAAVVYATDAQSMKVSMRGSSTFDVLPLALKMGGGGHDKAASFHLPISKLEDFLSGKL